ncbi:DUF262 domain-containing protein [Kribbella sp. NPDC051620]|uniref:DUF262 domain-containing protein n=1 Tax=Kribbella sp. NPDC051620 TaxID=3364120 RepID=UPI0037B63A25
MPTEAKDIFEATSKSLRELLSENGLGLYLPPYQRPYGWSKDKVEKLIDDTLHGLKHLGQANDSFTFLGTVITIHDTNHVTIQPMVRNEVPAKVLTVIDGQQRLSSLILLTVSLHSQIRLRHWQLFKGNQPNQDDVALTFLHEQTLYLMKQLGLTFYETQPYGDSPLYPRLIRAFDDQWARKVPQAIYHSPIANLIFTYSKRVEDEAAAKVKPTDFRPKARDGVGEGEPDLVKRFAEMRTILVDLAKGKFREEVEGLPGLSVLAENKQFQRALLNHELGDEVVEYLDGLEEGPAAELFRLVMLASYVLNRIALTVVKGKDEDYAFTIFESLNTTGEPLTAFETFRPRVVMAEGLAEYQDSVARKYMDGVAEYLSTFTVGDQLQNATRDLLISFALAETGSRLSKRLADQRAYMKDEFERHSKETATREAFLSHFVNTANFISEAWAPSEQRQFPGLPANATTDSVRLCVAFFKKLNHSIVIAPMVRFYSEALAASPETKNEAIASLEAAMKAMAAFTVLWRASRRTTANIDREYRDMMTGLNSLTGMGPLARTQKNSSGVGQAAPVVDVEALRAELRARLESNAHGDVKGEANWVTQASTVPLYTTSAPLTRFVLLAAYHDTVEDTAQPGLIRAGKEDSGPCLTYQGWADEAHLTVEHVAPQSNTGGWSQDFYAEKELVHRIGNLVLVPQAANSSLSYRPWAEKRILYAALGARSIEDARAALEEAALQKGITFQQSTEDLVHLSKHMPHLLSLGTKTEDWDPEFAARRSEQLLRLCYRRLMPWLGGATP